jgi:hypothetical protein
MNLTETQTLLREISAVDKRQVDQATTQMWFQILGHIPLDIAREAHILARKDDRIPYLEPKHIVAWAREAAFKLDRREKKQEEAPVAVAKEPTCKDHNKKIMSCGPCCRRMAEMSHLNDPQLLLWAKENIYA